jgi:hypothetical protein
MKDNWLKLIVSAMVFSLVACSGDEESNKAAEQTALKASLDWVAIMDAGQYAEGWMSASAYLKGAVPRSKWLRGMKEVRIPKGPVESREVKSVKYTTRLPNAPDGEYVIVEFETSFENSKLNKEIVAQMKERDGNWRVAGYHID